MIQGLMQQLHHLIKFSAMQPCPQVDHQNYQTLQ